MYRLGLELEDTEKHLKKFEEEAMGILKHQSSIFETLALSQ